MSSLLPKIDSGRYEIVTELCKSGMGIVFRAVHKRLNRFGSDRKQGASTSLKDAIAHVAQTRIVTAGTPPQKVIVGKFRALPVNQSLHFMIKILGALEYIHNRGVVHRDIKPSNVMLTRDGEPVLMDFGLAKSMAPGKEHKVTMTGQIMGTPAYMSPEQAEGSKERINETRSVSQSQDKFPSEFYRLSHQI